MTSGGHPEKCFTASIPTFNQWILAVTVLYFQSVVFFFQYLVASKSDQFICGFQAKI